MGKAERTRQFIIEQAAPIFNEKGIAGTTIDDILEATKMAKGGLYGHFKSKEEISYAMVDYLLEKLTNKVLSVVANEKTAKGKLFAFMEVYRNPLTSYIDGGCPILNFGAEADDTNPVIKQKVKSAIDFSGKNFISIIRRGIENKEFSTHLDAEEFTLKMLALLEGGMLLSRVMDSNNIMDLLINMLKKDLESYIPE